MRATKLDARLREMLDTAEELQRWVVPESRSLVEAFRRRAAANEVREPFPRMFARTGYIESLSSRAAAMHTLRALTHRHPGITFCSFSAALVHGLQVSDGLLTPVRVANPPQSRRKSNRHVRFHVVDGDDPVVELGLRATSLERTVMDCAREAPLADALGIVDSALHWWLTSPETLQRYLEARGTGLAGIGRAKRAVRLADRGSENGGESRLRAIMLERGFVPPILQAEIEDPMKPGSFARVDYLWVREDGSLVIAEFDGKGKYRAEDAGSEYALRQLLKERKRESHLNLTGATVIRFSYADTLSPERIERMLTVVGVPKRGDMRLAVA